MTAANGTLTKSQRESTMSEATDTRSPGLSYQDLLDTDTHPVPEVLRLEAPAPRKLNDLSIDRYTSAELHQLEMDKLWSRVWQFACREEHIAEPGDYYVYEIGPHSVLIVRDAGALAAVGAGDMN